MNTTISFNVIKTSQDSTIEIQNTIEEGFSEFDRIVNQYTRFNQESELSDLNNHSGEWFEVSQEFLMLITTMLNLARDSRGAFDPTVIDFLETYGYDKDYDFSKLEKPELDRLIEQTAKDRDSWKNIKLDPSNTKVKLSKGQRIDLGGIGKGYAIDCAFRKLSKFDNIMIDAGGDIRTQGHNESEEPWTMGLTDQPTGKDKTTIGVITASKMAIACSGSWARKVKQFHHLINPITGKPVEEMRTVFVSAPTATQADGWATALFVGGKDLLSEMPNEMEAMMIDVGDSVVKTSGFAVK